MFYWKGEQIFSLSVHKGDHVFTNKEVQQLRWDQPGFPKTSQGWMAFRVREDRMSQGLTADPSCSSSGNRSVMQATTTMRSEDKHKEDKSAPSVFGQQISPKTSPKKSKGEDDEGGSVKSTITKQTVGETSKKNTKDDEDGDPPVLFVHDTTGKATNKRSRNDDEKESTPVMPSKDINGKRRKSDGVSQVPLLQGDETGGTDCVGHLSYSSLYKNKGDVEKAKKKAVIAAKKEAMWSNCDETKEFLKELKSSTMKDIKKDHKDELRAYADAIDTDNPSSDESEESEYEDDVVFWKRPREWQV